MRLVVFCVGSAACTAILGCSVFTSHDCADIKRFSFSIQVADSATKEYIALGATLIARHDDHTDSLVVPGTGQPGASDATGTGIGTDTGSFDLVVRKVGYRDWIRTNVVVPRDDCGQPDTQLITAYLQHL
jgi:hypothetical protein